MNASVVSDLQTAILATDPANLRRILDSHTNALRQRPSCQKDGWSPLHVLAKSGEDYMSVSYKQRIRERSSKSGKQQGWELFKSNNHTNSLNTTECQNNSSNAKIIGISTSSSSCSTNNPDNNNLLCQERRENVNICQEKRENVNIPPPPHHHPPHPPPHPPWAWASDIHLERYHRARMAIVYMLCDSGVDINGRDSSGLTPLHYAARRGDAAVCEVLLQCGADLFAPHDSVALWDEVERAARFEMKGQPLNQINQNHQSHSSGEVLRLMEHETSDIGMEEETDDDDDGDGETQKSYTLQHRHYHYEQSNPYYVRDYRNCNCDDLNDDDLEDDPRTSPVGPATAIRRVFRFFWPGLWRAVATQNISKVRQLVNSWCRVDLSRGDMTLREVAVSTGNETIISLLLNIQPSMSLVHHSLAGNVAAVKELLESPSRKKINIDIRKLSERGAPLLYFLIRGSNYHLIQELRSHGASLYTHMLDHSMVDIPVIFTALEPWIEPEVVKSLLPDASSREARLLERVWNRGKNILCVAVEKHIHVDAIEAIIEVGGASLLCERDPDGLTVIDVALKNHHHNLVALMDRFVVLWLTRPDLYPRRRDLLALRGFDRLEVVAEAQDSLDQDVALFLQEYRRCQVVLQQMFRAVEEGETATMQQLLLYFESDIFYLVDLLWQGRLEGEGMPLLHWAVLHGREQIVNLILRAPLDHPAAHDNNVTTRFCPDDVRDQWRRTPLHYACGLLDGSNIIALLLDLGSSEHTLDMDGREPLDFRDARGSQALTHFMDNIRHKVKDLNCPDPWDPDTLRIHMDNQRRERFQIHHHQPHHHYHHHFHQSYMGFSAGRSCSPPLSSCPPHPFPYASHAHSRDMGISGWTYPAHFPTSPGSNFQWPLPHLSRQPLKEQKGGQRLCHIM